MKQKVYRKCGLYLQDRPPKKFEGATMYFFSDSKLNKINLAERDNFFILKCAPERHIVSEG